MPSEISPQCTSSPPSPGAPHAARACGDFAMRRATPLVFEVITLESSPSPENPNPRWETTLNPPSLVGVPTPHPQTTSANTANPPPQSFAPRCTTPSAPRDSSPPESRPSTHPFAHYDNARDSPHPAETASSKIQTQKYPDRYWPPPTAADSSENCLSPSPIAA